MTTVADTTPRFAGSLVLAARQFPRHRAAMIGLVLLLLVCLAAILAPMVAPYDPIQIKLGAKLKPPSLSTGWAPTISAANLLPSPVRRPHLAHRRLAGGGLRLLPRRAAGLASGYFGGRIDNLLMRPGRCFLTFPPLLLAVALVGCSGPDIQNVMLALGPGAGAGAGRMVRGSTLAAREEVYVTAARALGASPGRIVLSHLLRNVMSPIIVQLTIVFSRRSSPRRRCPSWASAPSRRSRAGAAT
jgi:peptide/nickel transport system permease protein